MKTISLKVDGKTEKEIQMIMRKKKVDRSVAIRSAIHEYYTKEKDNKKPSLYDRVIDIVGSAEGPPDLSTNKDYLKEYGSG